MGLVGTSPLPVLFNHKKIKWFYHKDKDILTEKILPEVLKRFEEKRAEKK